MWRNTPEICSKFFILSCILSSLRNNKTCLYLCPQKTEQSSQQYSTWNWYETVHQACKDKLHTQFDAKIKTRCRWFSETMNAIFYSLSKIVHCIRKNPTNVNIHLSNVISTAETCKIACTWLLLSRLLEWRTHLFCVKDDLLSLVSKYVIQCNLHPDLCLLTDFMKH
jgi:hypothetical protein